MKLGTNTIQTLQSHTNLDYLYGPYTTTDEAEQILHSSTNVDFRELGLNVGIYKFVEDEDGEYYCNRSGSYSHYDKNPDHGNDYKTYSIAGITEYWFQWNDNNTELVLSQKGNATFTKARMILYLAKVKWTCI